MSAAAPLDHIACNYPDIEREPNKGRLTVQSDGSEKFYYSPKWTIPSYRPDLSSTFKSSI